MYRTTTAYAPKTITLAQLCEALENGTLPSTREDDSYVIKARDLQRLVSSSIVNLTLPEIAARRSAPRAS